jgi:hypothetical protein
MEQIRENQLVLNGHATDHIWAMQHDDDLYGLRVDCGDSGTLFMTKAQAQEIIATLQGIISEEGIVRPEFAANEGLNPSRMPTFF